MMTTSSPSPSSSDLEYSSIGFLVLDTLGRPAEEMPPPGGATFVQQIRMTPAGTAGGTAMVCGILGLQGQLVSEVGQDDAGDFLIHKLQSSYNVQTNLIQRNTNGIQTSCSMLPIRSTAERAAFFCQGTAATFSLPSLVDNNNDQMMMIDSALNAKIIHLGGTGLLPKLDGEPSLQLLKRAKQLGKITTFDLILANSETAELVEPLLPYIDYFCPSIEEAAALAGYESTCRDVQKISKFFKDRGVKNVILSLDKDGVYVDPSSSEESDDEPFQLPAHDIKVVDTTGCGDSFTAGIIVGISKGWPLKKTAKFANAVAAQVALGLGSDGDGKLQNIESTLTFMETIPLRE